MERESQERHQWEGYNVDQLVRGEGKVGRREEVERKSQERHQWEGYNVDQLVRGEG